MTPLTLCFFWEKTKKKKMRRKALSMYSLLLGLLREADALDFQVFVRGSMSTWVGHSVEIWFQRQ